MKVDAQAIIEVVFAICLPSYPFPSVANITFHTMKPHRAQGTGHLDEDASSRARTTHYRRLHDAFVSLTSLNPLEVEDHKITEMNNRIKEAKAQIKIGDAYPKQMKFYLECRSQMFNIHEQLKRMQSEMEKNVPTDRVCKLNEQITTAEQNLDNFLSEHKRDRSFLDAHIKSQRQAHRSLLSSNPTMKDAISAIVDPPPAPNKVRAGAKIVVAQHQSTHYSRLAKAFRKFEGQSNPDPTEMNQLIKEAGEAGYPDLQTKYRKCMEIQMPVRQKLSSIDADLRTVRSKMDLPPDKLNRLEEKITKAISELRDFTEQRETEEMRPLVQLRFDAHRNSKILRDWGKDLTALQAATLGELEYRNRASAHKTLLVDATGRQMAHKLAQPFDQEFAAWEATKIQKIGMTHQAMIDQNRKSVERATFTRASQPTATSRRR